MCTAATYLTKDFYIGRTLDYEFSYGEEIAILPRNYHDSVPFYGNQRESLRDYRHGARSW